MKPDSRFTGLPKDFWATVRLISQEVGYVHRRTHQIRVPDVGDIRRVFRKLDLETGYLFDGNGTLTKTGGLVADYFQYRADVLQGFVRSSLMDVSEAKALYRKLHTKLKPRCRIPMNKQKAAKKAPAFFTGIINMLVEANAGACPCNYNPLVLTTVTKQRIPLRTLARRIDGAFPSPINPVAVWEIKEYYYTTTFGSRVADGVYESLLDGMEIEELRSSQGIDIKHYLMVDAYSTWWEDGRSYLCRLIDLLHMGYVDEVLFGREVVDRLPGLVREWVALVQRRDKR
ncbi:MAG: hypothetical protein M1376_13965 [Planctomycetes bacterium]|nr:hypothetical protein [Planctomycetota bacterium]